MALTKAEKVQILKRSFERQRIELQDGETDVQYVTRVVQERMNLFRQRFLEQQIQMQLSIETPKEQIDVSDL
jgi:hypothetical protein